MPELNVIVPKDVDDNYSNDDLFNISSWGADLSFREIISMYAEDELLKPELQRNYVWDKPEASRFIESLLLGLPVPSIFLAKTKDERYLIIDGYQRIMTVNDYIGGIFGKDGKVFKLTNTKSINERWRGRSFGELEDKDQRKLRNTTIHAIIFEQKHPQTGDTSLYQIFERINTSGRTLFPQEIRNCVYQGRLNKLIMKLNANSNWRELLHLETADDRMRDIEFVLRAIYVMNTDLEAIESKQILLKKELNDFMAEPEHNTEASVNAFETQFLSVLGVIKRCFGPNAFNTKDSKGAMLERFHPALADAVFFVANMLPPDHVADLSQKLRAVVDSSEFESLITERTTTVDNIKKKYKLLASGIM